MAAVGFHRGVPEDEGLDGNAFEAHRHRIKQHLDRGVFPGFAEAAISNGNVVFTNLCGYTDKSKRHRMSPQTLFRGYSMMKPITATAFMSLVDDGTVGLHDPVHRYIPSFKDLQVHRKNGKGLEALKKPMTLCHLLMHTSGLGYGPGSITPGVPLVARSAEEKHYKSLTVRQEEGDINSLEKLCVELARLPLLHQPGSNYAYGMSLDVLGHVMEIVTGQPLRKIIQTRVLDRVGMRDTSFMVQRSRTAHLAGYYRLMKDKGVSKRWLQRLDGSRAEDSMYVKGSAAAYAGGVPAAGGLWGAGRSTMLFSLRDVLLFCQMLLNRGRSVSGKRVLKTETVRSLVGDWLRLKRASDKPDPEGWGSDDVGWSPLGNIERYGPHAGALYMGGMSYFWLDPRRNIAAAIMTETYWQVDPLGWKAELDDLDQVIQKAVLTAKRKRQSAHSASTGAAKRQRR